MHVVERLRNSQFLRHNAVFFLGSVSVGVLNYAYYPVIGRLMEPAEFGEVQTLISLFLQLSILLTVFSLVTVNIVVNINDEERRNRLVSEFEKLALVGSLFILLLTILFQNQLQDLLQFQSSLPFVILGLTLVLTVPFTLRNAFLRGKQAFGKSSISNLVASAGKLLFSAVLVTAGLGTAGAIGGLAMAQAVGCAIVAWWAFKMGLRSRQQGKRFMSLPDMRLLLPELKYGLLVLAGSLAITFQYSIDILVVKHYFDAHTAGLYAGVAAAARIIFFLTASISQVMLPSVRMGNPPQENRRFLRKSFILFGLLSVPALLVFMLFPNFIVGTLMGNSYRDMADILPRLSLAIFLIAIINLFVSYYLALRRYGIAAVTMLGALITYALMLANHASITGVVNGLLAGSAAMLALLGLWAGGRKVTGRAG